MSALPIYQAFEGLEDRNPEKPPYTLLKLTIFTFWIHC